MSHSPLYIVLMLPLFYRRVRKGQLASTLAVVTSYRTSAVIICATGTFFVEFFAKDIVSMIHFVLTIVVMYSCYICLYISTWFILDKFPDYHSSALLSLHYLGNCGLSFSYAWILLQLSGTPRTVLFAPVR